MKRSPALSSKSSVATLPSKSTTCAAGILFTSFKTVIRLTPISSGIALPPAKTLKVATLVFCCVVVSGIVRIIS
ncbi:MAG: hypothetical protein HC859_02120 [Bacteroidia bacterium]|nr:hypothetical protein [Bacteroidia bacterium]